jgi:hypothetical protein
MSGLFGGGGEDPAAKAARKAQEAQMERLDAIDLPQLQKYLLESPELVGLLEAEGIDPSKMEDIKEDAGLRENQLAALQGLRDQSEQGLTAQDKYQMEQMLGDVSANERASQAQIEDQMARRGMQSSGAALMAQQQNKQSGANQARERAMQMAAQAQQNKMGALAQLGQQSGQMAGQDFNRKAQVASAQDAISRANAMNRQGVNAQNLAARQQIANQGTNIGNQNKQIGNQIDQQNFNNAIAKASGQGNVANAMSNIAANTPQQASGIQKLATVGGMAAGAYFGGPAGAGAGAQAGSSIGSYFEDGGVARQQKEQDDADKQHARFKKNYMKRVHQELEGGVPKSEPVHAQDGAMMNNEMFNFRDMQDDLAAAGRGELTQGAVALGRGNDLTSADIQTNEQAQAALPEQGIDGAATMSAVGDLAKLLQKKKGPAKQLNLGAFNMQRPENALGSYQPFADGGMYASDGMGDIVDSGMDSYADDRVDAKINDGEAILNVPQQQRFMDLVRGKISVDELGDDDIVEGVPKDYRDELHNKIEGNESSGSSDKVAGLEKLLEMLGRS